MMVKNLKSMIEMIEAKSAGLPQSRVLILSGGSQTDLDEAQADDVSFYVSGSVGTQNSFVRGTSVFGGDLVPSGTQHLCASLFLPLQSRVVYG